MTESAVPVPDIAHVDIHKLKVADLKQELKARGLSTTGVKNELVERLEKALETNNSGEADEIMDLNEEAGFEDDLTKDDFRADSLKPKSPPDIQAPVTPDESSDMSGVLDISLNESSVTEEPISSKEDLPDSSKEDLPDSSKEDLPDSSKEDIPDSTSQIVPTLPDKPAVAETVHHTEPAVTSPVATKVTDITSPAAPLRDPITFTDDEKLEMKAKNLDSSTDKLSTRAERFGIVSSSNSSSGGDIVTSPTSKEVEEKLKKRAERFGAISMEIKNVENVEKLKKRAERFGAISTEIKTVEGEEKLKKRAERFGALSISKEPQTAEDRERIQKRKERFGASLDSAEEIDAKKQKRSEKFGV